MGIIIVINSMRRRLGIEERIEERDRERIVIIRN